MGREQDQEMQTYREALKIIAANWKIFIQVTISLMLPVSCIFLAHSLIINRLGDRWASVTDIVIGIWATPTVDCISILLFILLSSSSAVFTFAYVYSSPNELTFRKVMTAAPRICRDLVHTFVFFFLGSGIYSLLFLAIDWISMIFISKWSTMSELVLGSFGVLISLLYFVGVYPIGATWQLASAVTMLEGVRGIEAVKRSVVLMKGNMRSAAINFMMVFLGWYSFAAMIFEFGVVEEEDLGPGKIAKKIAIGGSFMLLFFIVVSVGLVTQICFYFACKEYHSEIIDKLLLARHLEGYLYLPLNSGDGDGDGGGGGGEVEMEEVSRPV